ncbi:MAG: phage tail protein [Candidatus Dehalobacter alkaniphilus]
MAISTQGVTLKWGAALVSIAKVIDIKDFPDLGGAPELLETTTLSDAAQTFINGIQSQSAMEFTCNYTKADYESVLADAGTDMFYSLEFGEAGAEGKFQWQGQHAVWVVGAGSNAVTEMKISIAPSTQPTLATV